MDPLSLTGGITAVLDATTQIVGYLNDVKDASRDRAKLATEAASLLVLLTKLRYVEEADRGGAWFTGIRSLGQSNGPLEQFKRALEQLATKLEPVNGSRVKNFSKRLSWTLNKAKINDTLSEIERLKTNVGLTLQKDHL